MADHAGTGGDGRDNADRDAAARARQRAVDDLWADVAEDFAMSRRRTSLAAPSERVWAALRSVPRERFVGAAWRHAAWQNRPLPIGSGQTISQPFIVALMTALLDPQPTHRILEIGTGCGYQAAVLARLAAEVVSIERVAALAAQARAHLRELGIGNVDVHVADGWQGWPARAPYHGIIVTAGPDRVPPALLQQLARPGRLVLPVGDDGIQVLRVIDVDADGTQHSRDVLDVRFVPMPGGVQAGDDDAAD